MSSPAQFIDNRAEKAFPLEIGKGSHFFAANIRKESNQSKIKVVSSRVGLRVLEAFSAEAKKENISLKPGQFSLTDDFIDSNFVENLEVEDADHCDADSGVSTLPQKEEINDEEVLRLADPELKAFFQGFQAIDSLYDDYIALFKQFGEIQGLTLFGFEYGSANKDNIHAVAANLNPDRSDAIEDSLDTWDTCFKEINCLIPFITNGFKYLTNLYVQSQLKDHEQRFAKTNSDTQSLQSDPYSSRAKSIHQKCIEQLKQKLEQDQEAIEMEVERKVKSLKTLASRIVLIAINRSQSFISMSDIIVKNADKIARIAKHVVSIFMTAWDIDRVVTACTIQREWISHLQPYLTINVYSNQRDVDESHLHEMESVQQQVVKEVNEFLSSLSDCTSIEEVQARFEEVEIPFEGPKTIDEFQDQLENSGRFSRKIVQGYYYYRGHGQMIVNNVNFKAILSEQEEEYQAHIDDCLAKDILQHIAACQNKRLLDIKTYFKEHHIDIDCIELPDDEEGLPLPPQTEDEWEQCIQSEEFCRALAKELVRYHETLAKSTDLAARQSMLSKHAIERECLIFRGVGNSIAFLSSVIQVGLLCNQIEILNMGQQLSQSAIFLSGSSALEMFLKDISKSGIPGIGLVAICYPLYPNVSLKLENLFLLLAEHFVNVKHKPHEYSLEGYALAVQMNVIQFSVKLHALIFFCKQALLWLNIHLIENCIMHLKNQPFNEDQRFIQMNESYQERVLNYQHYIEDLKTKINELQIKDAELTMCPRLEKVRAHSKHLEPLKDIAEKLDGTVNIDLFPSHVIESIEDYTGFRLTNANKQSFRAHLEKLLTSSEADFIKIYQDYRFKLKA